MLPIPLLDSNRDEWPVAVPAPRNCTSVSHAAAAASAIAPQRATYPVQRAGLVSAVDLRAVDPGIAAVHPVPQSNNRDHSGSDEPDLCPGAA